MGYYDVGKDVSTVAFPSVTLATGDYPKLLSPKPQRLVTVYFAGGYNQRRKVLDLLIADKRIQADTSWRIIHNGPGFKSEASTQMGGARDDDYWEELQRSKYAMHIHGYQPFSPRLFEIIVAGAVPIIIAPGYVLPFEDILDWRQFSISVQATEAGKLY